MLLAGMGVWPWLEGTGGPEPTAVGLGKLELGTTGSLGSETGYRLSHQPRPQQRPGGRAPSPVLLPQAHPSVPRLRAPGGGLLWDWGKLPICP